MSEPLSPFPGFPVSRPRRLRSHPLLRELVRETELSARDLILPLFVGRGRGCGRRSAPCRGTTS